MLARTWLDGLKRRRTSTHASASRTGRPPSTPFSTWTIANRRSNAPSNARTFCTSALCAASACMSESASV
jgi:hypothetical protein